MYDFVSESFNKNISYEYKLSIQVSLNGFSFCIQKATGNGVLVFKNSDFAISGDHLLARRFRDWYNEEGLLQLTYKSCDLVINSANFSLVPEQLESEHLKKIISELLPDGKETEYAEGWIKSIRAKLVYHLPLELRKTITETLGESRLLHPVQKLVGYEKRAADHNLILAYFDEKDLYFLLKKEGELITCNYFHINHANDAVYFFLSVLQQFGLSAKQVVIKTSGKAIYLNELIVMLAKYFKSVKTLLPGHADKNELTTEILSEKVCLFN